eukprot:1194114-Prorocentrum_minimum.AAC.3
MSGVGSVTPYSTCPTIKLSPFPTLKSARDGALGGIIHIWRADDLHCSAAKECSTPRRGHGGWARGADGGFGYPNRGRLSRVQQRVANDGSCPFHSRGRNQRYRWIGPPLSEAARNP